MPFNHDYLLNQNKFWWKSPFPRENSTWSKEFECDTKNKGIVYIYEKVQGIPCYTLINGFLR